MAVLLITAIFSNVQAQEKGQIRAGLGMAFGTKAAIDDTGDSKFGVGINLNGDYFITDAISIAPGFTFFFGSSVNSVVGDLKLSLKALNIDGKYYFFKKDVSIYGLFGLAFGFSKVKTTFDLGFIGGGVQEIEASETDFGINIGAGVDYFVADKIFLNGLIKYNTPLSQLVFGVGAGYLFN